MANHQTSIDDLPVETISFIFKSLESVDLNRCARVSKKWNSVVENIGTELVVENKRHPLSFELVWYYTNRKVDLTKKISLDDIRLLSTRSFDLINVRFLFIGTFTDWLGFDFNMLVELCPSLEQLGFACITNYDAKAGQPLVRKVIELPTVKILNFNYLHQIKLKLNAPHLEVVYAYNNFGDLVFSDPRRIKHLNVGQIESNCSLAQFRNVEHFHCKLLFNRNVLTLFPSLKEFHYKVDSYDTENERLYARVKELMNHYLNQCASSKKAHIRLFYNGVQLEFGKSFEEQVRD